MSRAGEAGPHRLRRVVAERARELSEDAVRGGQVSADDLESLARLARLVEISETAAPARRRRWPVVALLVATLAAVSVLLFAETPETEIELDATMSEVGFTLPTAQVLADGMQLAAIGASGLRAVALPATGAQRAPVNAEAAAVKLSVTARGNHRGSITLARLGLPAGTRVWVGATDTVRQYRLSLRGLAQPLRVDAHGPVAVAGGGLGPLTLDLPSPAPVVLNPGPDPVDLDLEFPEKAPAVFLPHLDVRDLSLFRVDGFMDPHSPGVRRFSTILSGTLYFESLDGARRELRRREGLRFAQSRGEIRTLRLDGDRVTVDFRGRVRGMTTGSDESRRSLMPTVLEWLRARQSLALLWGTTLYVLGVVVAGLRWWRSPT